MDVALNRNTTFTVDQMSTLPEDISYSCIFWVDHLCAIEDDVVPIVGQLRDFLFRHLLHWFEAMSILRRSRDTILRLDQLLKWLSVSCWWFLRMVCGFANIFSICHQTHSPN